MTEKKPLSEQRLSEIRRDVANLEGPWSHVTIKELLDTIDHEREQTGYVPVPDTGIAGMASTARKMGQVGLLRKAADLFLSRGNGLREGFILRNESIAGDILCEARVIEREAEELLREIKSK